MKKLFAWRLTPSEAEFTELWQNATFVFDTNFLLDFYRRSRSTSEDFFKILQYLHSQDRIWLPYQVADEFFQKREEVMDSEKKSFEKALEALEKWKSEQESFKTLKDSLSKAGRIIATELEELEGIFNKQTAYLEAIKEVEESFKEKIEKIKHNHSPFNSEEDYILKKLDSLFEGKVRKPYNQEVLQNLYKEGEERYQQKIPPGFEDFKKNRNEKYGDFILWKQILEFAKTESKPIIFVTGEKKEDWWNKKNGETKSPHIELRREFQECVNQPFYLYQTNNFLEWAKEKFNLDIDPHSIEESNAIAEAEATDEQAYDDKQALDEITLSAIDPAKIMEAQKALSRKFRESLQVINQAKIMEIMEAQIMEIMEAQKALAAQANESLSAIIAGIKAQITPDFSQAIEMEAQKKINESLRAIEQQK